MSRRFQMYKTSRIWSSIKRKECYVLRIESGLSRGFNSFLKAELKSVYRSKIDVDTLDITNIDYDDKFIRQFVKKWMPNIGLDGAILPGYYLFRNGDLVAFHPGVFKAGEIDFEEEKTSFWVGAGIGFFAGLFSQNLSRGLDVVLMGMEMPQGRRIFDFFKSVLDGEYSQSKQRRQKKQRQVYDEELDDAYKILGCSSEQFDSEIKRTWMMLLQKHHPDKNFGSRESNQKTAEINVAYELIKKSREQMTL